MKFSSVAVAILWLVNSSSAAVSHGGPDKFHSTKNYLGDTMWIFGSDGIFVYSPDGKELKLSHDVEGICGPKEDYEGPSYHYCRFHDIVSDGKKYVWAAVNRGKPQIDVFDIDNAALVGSFDTCYNPTDLEYHSLRDEIWVRCSEVTNSTGGQTNLDVFSATNPTGDIQVDMLTDQRALEAGLTSNGYTVIHNALGDVGYMTDEAIPKLFKMDLSLKMISQEFDVFPLSNGLGKAVYSPVNGHVFVRSEQCCSCGFEGADIAECSSRGAPETVIPVTGNSVGQEVTGTCSRCEGLPGVDNVGVYEFDTGSGTVLTSHLMEEGFGGEPFVSPDGKYIVMLGKNGGETIRILKTGEQGLASRNLIDLELGFNMEGYEGKSVAKYFSFAYRNGKTLAVFPSGTEHKCAIVELPDEGYFNMDTVNVNYVTLNDQEFVNNAPHGMYRRVMWAEGTDYVWISDSNSTMYVVDIIKQEVVTTLSGFKTSNLLSVQNYERAHQIVFSGSDR